MKRSSSTRHAAVVGAGIAGLTAALELQKRGFVVTLYDEQSIDAPEKLRNISISAGGQFLPYQPASASLDSQHRLFALTAASRPFMEAMAAQPSVTGVMPIINVELVNDEIDWSNGLVKLMNASLHRLTKPMLLKNEAGHQETYDRFYEFSTFSLNLPRLLPYMLHRFTEHGGNVRKQQVSREMLYSFDCPVIQATGVSAAALANDSATYLRKGHTIRFRPAKPLPPVALSVDDLLLIPHEDGTFVVGALYMDKPNSSTPEEGESEDLLFRMKQLIRHKFGAFGPLEESVLDHPVAHRVGQRVVVADGPIIRKDPNYPNIVHAYAYGSFGCTTAFGGAIEAVDLLEQA